MSALLAAFGQNDPRLSDRGRRSERICFFDDSGHGGGDELPIELPELLGDGIPVLGAGVSEDRLEVKDLVDTTATVKTGAAKQ